MALFTNILLFYTLTLLSFVNSSPHQIKRVLMLIFPGGKSHNFVMKTLFNHTINNPIKFEYEYHIIVHSIDLDIWNDVKSNPHFKIYSYGNKDKYKEYFENSIEMMNNHPTFGFFNFNRGMMYNIKEFLNSTILSQLKGKHFDTVGTDIASYILTILKQELNIPNVIYLSPPALPQLLYNNIEINPSYLPAIGSKFTDRMTFWERVLNYFYQNTAELIFEYFQLQQTAFLEQYGYHFDKNIYYRKSMHFFQYPLAFAFPFSIPPNVILLNAITPRKGRPMKDVSPIIDQFLSKYKYNIYISQGTIMNVMDINAQINVIKHFELKGDYGFILSMRNDILKREEIAHMPKNVLVLDWVSQNDLLSDERVSLFINHGGINSVAESIYHEKPMVVLGLGLDQFNTASYVKKANLGRVYQDKKDITEKSLIDSILYVMNNKEIKENIKKRSLILKTMRDPKEEFQFWLDFGFVNGYECLTVDILSRRSKFVFNGMDVILFYMGIGILILLFVLWMYKVIYRCLCGNCQGKKRRKTKIE